MSSAAEPRSFPPDFLWGAATSAYQIEGSPLADGGGESIWHRFAREPGRVRDAEAVPIASDHYRRWQEDLGLMRTLGLNAYRFSVAWARVMPAGTGAVNQAGLDFYRRLVDGLLTAGIRPCLTLYHWDLPAALEDRGGWLHPDSADWFAAYAAVVHAALGDRVAMWATFNEPWVVMDAGYLHGCHAPGHRSRAEAAQVGHNLLRAHAAGLAALRAAGARQLGIVLNLEPKYPASEAPADRAAAQRADAYMNGFFLDPLLTGAYPALLPGLFGADWPATPAAELARIRQPLDWIGVNYYTRSVVRHDPEAGFLAAAALRQPEAPHMATNWEIYPAGLGKVLDRVWQLARPLPIYITENGAAFPDAPSAAGGRIEDPRRSDYLVAHLREARAALARGIDLRGYFVWSLLDNLEWAEGLSLRFGLVRVDPANQERTIKASGYRYAEIIRAGGRLPEP